ncbi:hypothetical protein WM41_2594 [Corynebacterium simulans]|uniref:Uncharacterized protein n=1 Tax=Corynebacterium simulans TaxID=146827 RepID=A0ABR5V615_9CORY|nr:hypothetical protein WM41_2594 [Corynebacterium simulans]
MVRVVAGEGVVSQKTPEKNPALSSNHLPLKAGFFFSTTKVLESGP